MRHFSLALISAVSAIALTQFASAADVPVNGPVYKAPFFGVQPWTGFYLGGTIGYGWSTFKPGTISFYQPASVFQGSINGINYSPKGVIGGAQAGYNYQFNNMMLGLEVDFSGTGIKGSVTDTVNNYTSTSKIDWLATARARAGVVMDRALIYATGGLAVAHAKTTLDDYYASGTITTSSSATYIGWTVGGGAEYALTPNWSVKAEYLYADLGSKDYNFYEPQPPGWPRISGTGSLTMSIARFGLNYQFH